MVDSAGSDVAKSALAHGEVARLSDSSRGVQTPHYAGAAADTAGYPSSPMAAAGVGRVGALDFVEKRVVVDGAMVAAAGEAGTEVVVRVAADLGLYQVAFWQESVGAVARELWARYRARLPGALRCEAGEGVVVLRVQPFKCLVLSEGAAVAGEAAGKADYPQAEGSVLDLSHAYTQVSVLGVAAAALLNKHIGLDLRERVFGAGSVASTVFHHVGVTVFRRSEEARYDLLIPRSFAQSLTKMLIGE